MARDGGENDGAWRGLGSAFFDRVQAGVTTDAIDKAVHAMITDAGAYPSPLTYGNFPKSVCTSVNECICHGIPDARPLVDGDIINIDVTVYLEVSARAQDLVRSLHAEVHVVFGVLAHCCMHTRFEGVVMVSITLLCLILKVYSSLFACAHYLASKEGGGLFHQCF